MQTLPDMNQHILKNVLPLILVPDIAATDPENPISV
jgi:hypothetical protein